jgi:hypothetical protein
VSVTGEKRAFTDIFGVFTEVAFNKVSTQPKIYVVDPWLLLLLHLPAEPKRTAR